jgi:alkylation response protein AidB-like acyl-CoA dehydrogenase
MSGGAEFNEVFFDGACIPRDHLVGEVNDGWTVAMTTLMNERYAAGIAGSIVSLVRPLIRLAKTTAHDGEHAIDSPLVRQDIARTFITAQLLELTGYRSLTKVARGGVPGPEGSIIKLVGARLVGEIAAAGGHVLGAEALLRGDDAPDGGRWALAFLGGIGQRLGGGTDEIMRNIIGERILGLPKEPMSSA